MTDVFLVIGSAATVTADLAAWGDRPAQAIAVNRAIRSYPGDLWAGATLHPELAAEFARPGVRLFAPEAMEGVTDLFPKRDMLNGTSALYAVRIALGHGARRVVVAGCPLDGGAYCDDRPPMRRWLNQYRTAWQYARRELAGRVWSLSGWTAGLLGTPDHHWLSQR